MSFNQICLISFIASTSFTFGEKARVLSFHASVNRGDESIGDVFRGQEVDVLEIRGQRAAIRFESEGKFHVGWVNRADILLPSSKQLSSYSIVRQYAEEQSVKQRRMAARKTTSKQSPTTTQRSQKKSWRSSSAGHSQKTANRSSVASLPPRVTVRNSEVRSTVAELIRRDYGIAVDWERYSFAQLIDMQTRLGTTRRILKTHGVMFDWQKSTFAQLVDAENRMNAAKRLSQSTGRKVDWKKYTFRQLMEAEFKVAGASQATRGRQDGFAKAAVPNVIESKIDGDFEGWEGDTVFKLLNGQIWQQTEFHFHYHYAFMPNVLIYKSNTGWKMKVDGVRKAIGVKRLK